MTTLYEGAFAKINLTLDVLGKRADGYHDLQSVMQTISIRDDVEIDVGTGKPWRLLCSVEGIPTDEKNLAWKAAKVYCDAMDKDPEGLEIRIVKRIPAGAGLGGGSADGDQTGPHPGCTVCAVSGSRLCVFLWNGDYHTGFPEEDAGKDVQPHAGFADQIF